jgi:uncharacterized protein (DUF2062 family)
MFPTTSKPTCSASGFQMSRSSKVTKSRPVVQHSGESMRLDKWLTRLVTVPPGQSPLAFGLAIGMRIALFILVPFGIIVAIAIALLHR